MFVRQISALIVLLVAVVLPISTPIRANVISQTTQIHIVSDATAKYAEDIIPSWESLTFEDTAWSNVVAPSRGTCSPVSSPPFPNTSAVVVWGKNAQQFQTIYVRKTFTVQKPVVSTLRMVADDDFDLYINGTLVKSESDGVVTHYSTDISTHMVSGLNVIAIKVKDSYGACQGLAFDLTIEQETSPEEDSDKDGLPNEWETNGIDVNRDGKTDLDLYDLGARPDHKDIFVEIDYMPGQKPKQESLDDVIKVFRESPVDVPKGINLHLIVDEEVPLIQNILFQNDGPAVLDSFNDIKLGSNNPFPGNNDILCGTGKLDAHFGTIADREHSNCLNIIKAKRMAFRYAIFAESLGDAPGGVTGQAEVGGNDFIITLGDSGRNFDPLGNLFTY